MMKYLKQTNRYSCGAIALINLFKLMGRSGFGRESVKTLNSEIKTDPKEGTEDVHLLKFLRKKGMKARSINSLTPKSLQYILKQNYYVIATIETPFYNHYSTIIASDKYGVTFSNNFTWKDLQKDHQSIRKLKDQVYYKYSTIYKICSKKDHDLSVIIIKKT